MIEENASPSAGPRNIALVGPTGSGTSSVFNQIANVTGAVGSDSLGQLRVVSAHRDGVVLTVLDTPGDREFEGDVRAALRAADNVVFVLAATAGVDAATIALWKECADRNVPRFIVITNLDQEHADYDEMVAICQRVFGPEVVALHYPVLADDGSLGGLIDIVSMQVKDHTGPRPTSRAADPEHITLLTPARQRIGEALLNSSASDEVVEAVMNERDLGNEVLEAELHRAVALGDVAPVLVAATSPVGLGASELVDLLIASSVAPIDFPHLVVTDLAGDPIAPISGDPNGPLAAQVIAASTNHQSGALTRVFSGTLHTGSIEHVRGDRMHSATVEQLTCPGVSNSPGEAIAGALVLVHGVTGLRPGDTLAHADTPLRIAPWPIPRPQHALLIHGASLEDVRQSLVTDRTVRVDDGVVWCMGEQHRQAIETKLRTDLGSDIRVTSASTRLRETVTESATATDPGIPLSISVAPLPPGSGLTITGLGAGPETSARLETALRTQLTRGPRAGLPVIDVAVTVDGPSDDANSDQFVSAAQTTLRKALELAGSALLEPQVRIVVRVSQDDLDAVIQDLTSRRAHGVQTSNEPGGVATLRAHVPESEVTRYEIELTNMAEGSEVREISPDGFTPLPNYLTERYLSSQLDSSNSRV